jgi:hypothetical protein
VWATLIALMEGDEVVVGLASAPALQRAGGRRGRRRLHRQDASQRVAHAGLGVDAVENASLSYSSRSAAGSLGAGRSSSTCMRDAWRTRAYGDFWSYMLLAEGAVDIATEPDLALHDMAALDVIVREAGGSLHQPRRRPGPVGPGALATNGLPPRRGGWPALAPSRAHREHRPGRLREAGAGPGSSHRAETSSGAVLRVPRAAPGAGRRRPTRWTPWCPSSPAVSPGLHRVLDPSSGRRAAPATGRRRSAGPRSVHLDADGLGHRASGPRPRRPTSSPAMSSTT